MGINNSGDPGDVNSSFGSRDFGISELTHIGAEYGYHPHSELDRRRRLQEAEHTFNLLGGLEGYSTINANLDKTLEAIERIPNRDDTRRKHLVEQRDLYKRQMSQFRQANEAIMSLKPQIDLYNSAKAERLNTQAANVINREFSESRINTYVAGLSNSDVIQTSGAAMASQGWDALTARRQEVMASIGAARASALGTAPNYIGENGPDPFKLLTIGGHAQDVMAQSEELARIEAGLRTIRQQGGDPMSRQAWRTKMGIQAQDLVDMNKLREEIGAGKGEFGNLTSIELKKKEQEAAENLIKAQHALANCTEDTRKSLTKAADDAAKALEDVQKAAGAGGGNRMSGWAMASMGLTTAAQLATMGSDTTMTMGVNIPMANMQNRTGFANIENQKYDSWRAAIAGNMTERLNLAGWNMATQFGADRKTWANVSLWEREAAGITTAAAGVTQGVEVYKNLLGAQTVGTIFGNSDSAEAMYRAGLVTAQGITMSMVTGKDLWDGTTAGATKIAGINAGMNAVRQINHIPGRQLQDYRDHVASMYAASTFMGGRAENFLGGHGVGGYAGVTRNEFMGSMMLYGLGSEEAGQLALTGAQNFGSVFNQSQILQAKRFENLGLGSAEEQMRRMSSLAAGGSQNPSQSLEKMLERAVGVGMDSSKAISMIAESTGTMAEQAAMKGMSGTGDEIGALIMRGYDRSHGVNQEVAARQAIVGYQSAEQRRNDRSATYHGMFGVGRLMKHFGLDYQDAEALQGMDTAFLNSLKGKSEAEQRSAFWERGIVKGFDKVRGRFEEVLTDKLLSQAEGNGGYFNGAGNALVAINNIIARDPNKAKALFDRDVAGMGPELAELSSRINWNSQNAGINSVTELKQLLNREDKRATLGAGFTGQAGGTFGDVQGEMSRQFVQATRSGMTGAEWMMTQGFGYNGANALANTGRTAQSLSSEGSWTEAAKESAHDLGESAKSLDKAGSKLLEAADRLISYATEKASNAGGPTPPVPQGKIGAINSLTQVSGSTGAWK